MTAGGRATFPPFLLVLAGQVRPGRYDGRGDAGTTAVRGSPASRRLTFEA
jgi:hypothetical protein